MLRLPATVCGSRAAVRTHHDAGVQGPRAYAVVGMMHKQLMDAGDPKLKEGFDSILVGYPTGCDCMLFATILVIRLLQSSASTTGFAFLRVRTYLLGNACMHVCVLRHFFLFFLGL